MATQASEHDRNGKPSQMLFANVDIFDGNSRQLIEGKDVLIESNLIKRIGRINAPKSVVIDGGGRTLMPGLIDSPIHFK